MKFRNSFSSINFLSIVVFIFLLIIPALAETDPNPNSPTPILISQKSSTRALAKPADNFGQKISSSLSNDAFKLDQKIIIYVTNLDLMQGEGAKAFRVFAKDANGKIYRFPVLDLRSVKGREWIYQMTVLLKNEIPFLQQPTENGDLLLNVSWRGLASNQVKLGLGKMGGKVSESREAVPTPLENFTKKPVKTSSVSDYVGYRFSGDRKRFIEQATFGPTVQLDQRIRRIGLRTWLAEQFQAPYPSADNPYPDLPLRSTDPDNETLGCGMFPDGTEERIICKRDFYTMYRLQNWFMLEAFYGEPQLRHRVAWALNQLWVTSGNGVRQSSHMVAYHKILSGNAFGNYRDLMKEMTLNPAMGDYLDLTQNTKDTPNENYAREVLQLFTIGLFMLNQDGTLRLNRNGDPIPTYSQETINNFTKVLTGWYFCNNGNNPQCPNAIPGTLNFKDPLILDQNKHNTEAKTLLLYPNAVNEQLPAGQSGATDLDQALDNIFYHPNVAPFVSRFLIQKLVRSDPTPAYVERIANIFNDNGIGVRGDLKAVVRGILLDPEARGDVKTETTYGKLREPVLFLTNVLRHFNVRSADGTTRSDGSIDGTSEAIGQSVFYSPTVFNYYAPNYIIPGTSLNAPEFGIMNTEIAINRYNQIHLLVFETLGGGTITYPLGTSIDLSEMEALSEADLTGQMLLDTLNKRMFHETMSADMRDSILTAIQAVAETNHRLRAQTAVYLAATASQYQIQR
jgi:uncharacterized protein (DUF1800 family)